MTTSSFWDAFDQGYKAFNSWDSFSNNPYEKSSEEWQWWAEGYVQAESDRGDDDCQ